MEDDLNLFCKWKTTSIFFNGRRPQFFNMEDNLIFFEWKTTLYSLKLEDDLISFENGRQPHFL